MLTSVFDKTDVNVAVLKALFLVVDKQVESCNLEMHQLKELETNNQALHHTTSYSNIETTPFVDSLACLISHICLNINEEHSRVEMDIVSTTFSINLIHGIIIYQKQ